MQKKILFPLILAGLLSACASAERKESAADKVYSDIKVAAIATKPLVTVQEGKFVNIDIAKDSPSILGQKSPNKFEVIAVDGKKGQQFNLIVAALCDCFGFRKWSVSPEAYLLGTSGDITAQQTFINPVVRTLQGTFPDDGEYKVLVMADDTYEGRTLTEIPLQAGLILTGISLPQTVHPTGRVQIYWKKNN